MKAIREGCAKRVLAMLEDMAENRKDDYAVFWREFGQVLKEGIGEDIGNQARIAALLRFNSTVDAPAQPARRMPRRSRRRTARTGRSGEAGAGRGWRGGRRRGGGPGRGRQREAEASRRQTTRLPRTRTRPTSWSRSPPTRRG